MAGRVVGGWKERPAGMAGSQERATAPDGRSAHDGQPVAGGGHRWRRGGSRTASGDRTAGQQTMGRPMSWHPRSHPSSPQPPRHKSLPLPTHGPAPAPGAAKPTPSPTDRQPGRPTPRIASQVRPTPRIASQAHPSATRAPPDRPPSPPGPHRTARQIRPTPPDRPPGLTELRACESQKPALRSSSSKAGFRAWRAFRDATKSVSDSPLRSAASASSRRRIPPSR